ncbi:MAG: biotin--[acetyl-CoA-carboxylase] ligase [Cellulosilyticaceae bacterium]
MTKEHILRLFESHKGEILSGEELATHFGMSRTAIWKAINLLREEGYDIQSIRKKGYRLDPNSDILSLIKIQNHLMMPNDQVHIEIHKTIDSTNRRLKELALDGALEWTVVASEMQTAGKGRAQREFISPEGKGVYMSILLRPAISWEAHKSYLAQVYESIQQVITALTRQEVTQVGGNDLCIDGKKVAGVLTELSVEAESALIQSIVVGIGINIYDRRQAGCEDQVETALSELTGDYCNRSEVIATLLNKIYERVSTNTQVNNSFCG